MYTLFYLTPMLYLLHINNYSIKTCEQLGIIEKINIGKLTKIKDVNLHKNCSVLIKM